jgi:hypothetical protein
MELRPIAGEAAVGKLAHRLTKAGADRLAAMWEVASAYLSQSWAASNMRSPYLPVDARI